MDTQIIQILKSGGIAVIPTDTQYGIVAQALNKEAVEKVYLLRKRAPEKPFIILISSIDDLKLFDVTVNQIAMNYLATIWPNPVSVVLPVSSNDFAYLHRGTNTLAFRIPNDNELLNLLKETGPLIAPSANLEGFPYAKTISEAKEYFGDSVDFYEDKGTLESNPSTLIKIGEQGIEILRQGKYDKITELLNMTDNNLLEEAKIGFKTLGVSDTFQTQALKSLESWLSDPQFKEYVPQIEHLIKNKYWDYLLDSFYQVIPFGTGGRRGEVGIGPNRINPWTIKSSAQGHSQYLLKKHPTDTKDRGIVLAYDIRQFFSNQYFDDNLPNPVKNLTSKDLAKAAAEVYAANDIKIYFFNGIRTTPELSFAIRYKKAIGGDMFSASHNPPDHNGKKIYDEYGGQLIPPDDEELVKEVTENVGEIKGMNFQEAEDKGLIVTLGEDVDQEYIKAAASVSLSDKRNIKIAYTPLHGCGSTSVVKVLEYLGFKVAIDEKTSSPSGKFENITFNIPNPEVEQSFDTPLKFAKEIGADILLNSDPDADRIGIMVLHDGEWLFLNGNEIAAILAEYSISKRAAELNGKGIAIKTLVTTNLISEISKKNNVTLIGDLLVGYKYVAHEMNKLESAGKMDYFIFGCEESHGYNAGNYARDKDAATAAIWLSELAAELKPQGKTLVDYLYDVYSKYGYFRNYLTEVRLPGAEGKAKIDQMQDSLRNNPPQNFGEFEVSNVEDYQKRLPILSDTDMISKNILEFNFKPVAGTISMKVTVRPSGTEPKIKMYYEIGSEPFAISDVQKVKEQTETIRSNLEKSFMKTCYKIIGIDFPERGFLLFWQLPLDIKLKYFQIEKDIVVLKEISDKTQRQEKLDELLKFLGSNPVEKVDKAFQAEYKQSISQYLDL
ncbi:MAG: L-threonylcarbamoyladenylate synthase [Microgenomates group bacterium]|jgi:phosphoglucomutase/phosphomannomutase